MIHTSINFPTHLGKAAKRAQEDRGFKTFTAYLCDVVRRDLIADEFKGVESRLAASHRNLGRKVDDLKRSNSAVFTLIVTMTRELLALNLPPARVDAAIERILTAVRDDVSGAPLATEEENFTPDFTPVLPTDEEIPFGDFD